jgi:transcriptional antiterminator RfaH
MDRLKDEQAKWYALYTRSRAEKLLSSQLTQQGIECFLPLKKELKVYSDRKKWIEEPLIRSYLFVRVDQRHYYQALNTAGAVRYVCFEGRAAAIPDSQIHALQQLVYHQPLDLELVPGQLTTGDWVEVSRGPLAGVRGELLQLRGKHRLLLRFQTLGVCVHSEVNLQDVKQVYSKQSQLVA